MKELQRLRKKIDGIDAEILDALNRRSEVVLEIGRIKRDGNVRFYSPEREKQVIERLMSLNKGPFPGEALSTIYREILSASLSLEEPLKVAFLGPLATFSHLAALGQFGSSAHVMPLESIKRVFEAVDRGDAEFGMVPIENSTEGVVTYTLDMFIDFDLKVSAEVMLEVSHNLLSKSGNIKKVKKIYSLPMATAQCRRWLEANMPGIPVLEATSTAKAAEIVAREENAAAIASELAANIYNLRFIHRHIEDSRHNVTRFLVISKEFPPKSSRDKTSIMFSVKDKPGALYNILTPFKRAKINLTKIESRPSKRKAWEYIFFVDMEGHIEDKRLKQALDEMKKECLFLKVLGSYPYGG
ncbi:MAG: prephenate dehydratase [Thermodesulfovibrionales bacterium]|nr:prephenate dehydratase [Thermodesulfovibrionales bacterium]